MTPLSLLKKEIFGALPPEWSSDPLPEVLRLIAESRTKVVVLDDDPTGTQTVHDVSVLTEWSIESIKRELLSEHDCFFVLTNSRSLSPDQARKLNLEIARSLKLAGEVTDHRFVVVSRSDSTLRGHFHVETTALSEVLGPFDGILLAPFYETGGRHTIDDVHYLAAGDWLIPVAETEFARDATFGYRNSRLPAWVEEKTKGDVAAREVASISIADIRCGGPDRVFELLMQLRDRRICVANLASGRDLLVFIQGLLQAEALGKRFLYRTAASFAAARGGIVPRGILDVSELALPKPGGGLVVVGSYVPKTSGQLRELLNTGNTVDIEVNVRALLDVKLQAAQIEGAANAANAALELGLTVVLYTSRELVTGDDPAASLSICCNVSDALMQILCRISARPRFIIAKGGITSSDVATRALRVKRALVLGQIIPGVPLWRLGEESRWPGLIYVSFPGNLGGPGALKEVVQKLVSV